MVGESHTQAGWTRCRRSQMMRVRSCWCSGASFWMVGSQEEDYGTVDEREEVRLSKGQFGPFPAISRKRDRRRIRGGA